MNGFGQTSLWNRAVTIPAPRHPNQDHHWQLSDVPGVVLKAFVTDLRHDLKRQLGPRESAQLWVDLASVLAEQGRRP